MKEPEKKSSDIAVSENCQNFMQNGTVYLARARGFCAGVRRAIDTVEACLAIYGPPIYVFHAIVHNRRVVDDFRDRGVEFVENISEVPTDRPLIFSAHGVSAAVERQAGERGVSTVIDATCPLVKRVHDQARCHCAENRVVILVGHREHPEIQGTLGQVGSGDIHVVSSPDEVDQLPASLAGREIVCLAQTTLAQKTVNSVSEAIARRFTGAKVSLPESVCYASANRQREVFELAKLTDLILVVGSRNSSNVNRLCETALAAGVKAYLLDSVDELDKSSIVGYPAIGVTAGASTPYTLVSEVLYQLAEWGWDRVRESGVGEYAADFKLPEACHQSPPESGSVTDRKRVRN